MKLSPRGLFLLLAPLATAVLAWTSYQVVTREQDALQSRLYWQHRTEVQRVVEQLDAAVAALLDRIAAVPYGAFRPYMPHPDALTERTFEAGVNGPVRPKADTTLYLPSPLLLGEAQFENLGLDRFYFEFAPRDIRAATVLTDLRSPALPRGRERDLALALAHTTPERLTARASDLEALVRVLGPDGLVTLAAHPALNYTSPLKWSRSFTPLFVPRLDGDAPELLLLRLVDSPGRGVRLQGVWFNWPGLADALVELAAPMVADGSVALEPLLGGETAGAPSLASTATNTEGALGNLNLGVRVTRPEASLPPWTTTTTTLAGAWVVYLLALAAIDLSLRRALALSERRARFASAVTHELRTPLTTLCMYTEMLRAGLVPEAERERYYATLEQEADRLAALVDNVLDHAGLESGRKTAVERVELGPWLAAWCARDAERAPETPVLCAPVPKDAAVRAEPAGLERILTNLASNARRYGAPPLELEVVAGPQAIALVFRDGGPGIADPEAVFEPYVRGGDVGARADTGAGTSPGSSSTRGLGLGLALSRELARAMGGDLELLHAGPGPAAEPASATAAPSQGKNGAKSGAPTTFRLSLPRDGA